MRIMPRIMFENIPGPEVIKLSSFSSQMSTRFQQLIKTKKPINIEVSCFKSPKYCINPATKCRNADFRHFKIYEQDKFRARLS